MSIERRLTERRLIGVPFRACFTYQQKDIKYISIDLCCIKHRQKDVYNICQLFHVFQTSNERRLIDAYL